MGTKNDIKICVHGTYTMSTQITSTGDAAANSIFDLINKAEQFGEHKIDIIITKDEKEESILWFKGKDICNILGYKISKDAVRDNVDAEDKIRLQSLIQGGGAQTPSKNLQKNTIYINESGLYSLILNSKLPAAKAFKKWVTSELLPKIRRMGQEKYLKEIQDLKTINREKEDHINRLHHIQKDLLSYKKRVTKTETVYIVSTPAYAKQGIFKIGRTKQDMKFRSSGHNTTHIKGDEIKVLKAFAVHDCKSVEKYIHSLLRGLTLRDETEFFMCPYDLLESVVEIILEDDGEHHEHVNRIIDNVCKLKEKLFDTIEWTKGITPEFFETNIRLIEGTREVAKFDVSNASEEQKQAFMNECVYAYRRTIEGPNQTGEIVWKLFQDFLISELRIAKSRFRPSEWRHFLEEVLRNDPTLLVRWRMMIS
jgi:prophage antirepressor-like protein